MRDFLGVYYDAEGPIDKTATGWIVDRIGECGIGFEVLTQHHLGRDPVQHMFDPAVWWYG